MGFDLGKMFTPPKSGNIWGGFFGGQNNMPSDGGEGQAGGSAWRQNPQYPGVSNAMTGAWDYVSKGLQSIQAGQPPTWFKEFRPLEEYQRKNALRGTYYGEGAGPSTGARVGGVRQSQGTGGYFGPGVLATQRAADVKAGRRGSGGGSNYAKQLDQYAQGMTDIDNYLSELGVKAMDVSEQRYLQSMSAGGLSQGPTGDFVDMPHQPTSAESIGQATGDWAGQLQKIFGNYGQQPATSNDWFTPVQDNPYGQDYSDLTKLTGSQSSNYGGFQGTGNIWGGA